MSGSLTMPTGLSAAPMVLSMGASAAVGHAGLLVRWRAALVDACNGSGEAFPAMSAERRSRRILAHALERGDVVGQVIDGFHRSDLLPQWIHLQLSSELRNHVSLLQYFLR